MTHQDDASADAFLRQYDEKIRKGIETYGRHIVGVNGSPIFYYTIGNALADKPELLVFGLGPSDAPWLLNALSARDELKAVKDGDLIGVGGNHPVKLVRAGVAARAEYSCITGRYLKRDDYPIFQVLVPDLRGIYPDDMKCDARYRCPILREPLQ